MISGMRLGAFAISILIGMGAYGADYVRMKNGDRITGEFKKIWNEEVLIDPEYGETYAIKMKHVAYIHTDDDYEIEFLEGRRVRTVIGHLGEDDAGRPAVIINNGQATYPMSMIDNMVEVEEFFKWEFKSDISINVASGNTDTNSARVYLMGGIKLGEHRHKLEFTRDGASASGELTKDQTDVYYEDVWTFKDDWFVRGSLTWTRDPLRDLQSRSQAYLGPGFHFWADSKRTLNLSLGPNLLLEDIGDEVEQSVAIQTVFRYEQKFLDDGDLVVFQETDLQSVVSGRENKILNTSTGIRWSLPRDLYINFQIDYDYESNPAEGRDNDDLTYLVGVGIKLD